MINGRINDVGDGPTDDNLQGQGFADHSRQLSWQCQVQSTKYPEFEAQSLFRNILLLKASNSLHEP